jgi:DNA-binding NarL/FixJ family response regulator
MKQRQGPLRVYLVEDSFIMGNLLKELIAGIGATVVGRSDSATIAIAEMAVLDVDVVVVDLALLEGSGFDVLQATRSNASGKRPVRIVLTNHSTPAYRDAAARLDIDSYFDKSKEITKMIEFLATLQV